MDIKSTRSAIWNVRPKHPNAPMAKKTCRTKGSMKSVHKYKRRSVKIHLAVRLNNYLKMSTTIQYDI